MVDGYLRTLGTFNVVITADHDLLADRLQSKIEKRAEMYDAPVILRANAAFNEIATSGMFTGFGADSWYSQIDVDAQIHLTKENPWPTPTDVENVLRAYMNRKNQWELTVAWAKPTQIPFCRPVL